MQTYSEEEKEFLKRHSYIEDVIDGHHVRYILSGAKNTRPIVFMNGLEIQQMFMRYVAAFEDEYKVLIDIFSKNDQKTLEELLPEPEVHYMRGSHHGPWVLQDEYIIRIRDFLERLSEKDI